MMSTLTIKDLPMNEVLDRQTMSALRGGIGRTPQQILAWEVSGKPATWQGMVLGDDGQLHQPSI
jgi:hypothetical protein